MRQRERKRLKEEEFLLGSSVCRLCKEGPNEEVFGKFFTAKEDGFSVHQYCLLFASGLAQRGEDDEGFDGFLMTDIKKEISRSRRLRCNFCKKLGATIGCCQSRCSQAFHYKCGRERGSLFQFFDSFNSYCLYHRPTQSVNLIESSGQTCPICLCEIDWNSRTSLAEVPLKTPCCRNSWFHNSCLQRHAHSSGLFYFRCPVCNNMELFQQEMKRMGIYIPEQDASWEKGDAFADLLFQYSRCDAEKCICPHGREHEQRSGKWRIRLCDSCGQFGTHLKCQHWKRSPGEWHCDTCGNTLPYSSTRQRPVGDRSMDPYTSDEGEGSSTTEDCEVNVCTISDDDAPLAELKCTQEEQIQLRSSVKTAFRDGASPLRKRRRLSAGTSNEAGPSNLEEYLSENSRSCASYFLDSLHSASVLPNVLLTLSDAVYTETVEKQAGNFGGEVQAIVIKDTDSECSSQTSEDDVKIITENPNCEGNSKTGDTGVQSNVTVDGVGVSSPESRKQKLAKLNSVRRSTAVVKAAEADSSEDVDREAMLSEVNLLNCGNKEDHDGSDDDACLITKVITPPRKPCPYGNDKFGKCMLTCCNPTKFLHPVLVASSPKVTNSSHKDLQIETVSSSSSNLNHVPEKSDADGKKPLAIDEDNGRDESKECCSVGTNTTANIAPSVKRVLPSRQTTITETFLPTAKQPSSPSGQNRNLRLKLRRQKKGSFRERKRNFSSLRENPLSVTNN